jgi:hypothetical protein
MIENRRSVISISVMTPYILQLLTRFGLAALIAKIRDRHGLITGAISNGAFYEIERTRVHLFSDGCLRPLNGNLTASGRKCGVPGNQLMLRRLDAACRSNRDVINSVRPQPSWHISVMRGAKN